MPSTTLFIQHSLPGTVLRGSSEPALSGGCHSREHTAVSSHYLGRSAAASQPCSRRRTLPATAIPVSTCFAGCPGGHSSATAPACTACVCCSNSSSCCLAQSAAGAPGIEVVPKQTAAASKSATGGSHRTCLGCPWACPFHSVAGLWTDCLEVALEGYPLSIAAIVRMTCAPSTIIESACKYLNTNLSFGDFPEPCLGSPFANYWSTLFVCSLD